MSHKALVFPAPAEPFQLIDRPTPKPGPGQVLIKNVAVALNPVDYVVQHLGVWVDHYGFPAVSGFDGAGEIATLGEGVQGLKIGDRVCVFPATLLTKRGRSRYHPRLYEALYSPDEAAFQEYTVADAVQIAKASECLACLSTYKN